MRNYWLNQHKERKKKKTLLKDLDKSARGIILKHLKHKTPKKSGKKLWLPGD